MINPAYPALRRAIDLDRLDLRPFTAGLAVRDDAGLRRLGHPARAPQLLPGALGAEESAEEESFAPALEGLPEYPHYTRPAEVTDRSGQVLRVPDVLRPYLGGLEVISAR